MRYSRGVGIALSAVLFSVVVITGSAQARDKAGRPPRASKKSTSPVRFWIVSSRHCPLGARVAEGTSFDYLSCREDGSLEWGDEAELHKSLVPGAPVCVAVHGSFVKWNNIARGGLRISRWLKSAAPEKPLNVVIFSWRSEGPFTVSTRGLVFTAFPQVDIGVLGRRSAFAGLYLARFVTDLPEGHPVSLFGHSHGARTIASSLHVMAGGQVLGYVLADPPKKKRQIRTIMAAAALDHHWLNPKQRYDRALDATESLINLRNHRDTVLQIYPLRHPFSNRALAVNGFSAQDYVVLGRRASRIKELDVSPVVGTVHGWSGYYSHPEIARAIAGYVHFNVPLSGQATSVEDTRRGTIRR